MAMMLAKGAVQNGSSALICCRNVWRWQTVRGDGARLFSDHRRSAADNAELTHGGADVALDCSGNAAGACWHCNPLLTGGGWFTLVKRKSGIRGQRRSDAPSTADYWSWVTSLFHMEKCAHDLTDWNCGRVTPLPIASRWNRQVMPSADGERQMRESCD